MLDESSEQNSWSKEDGGTGVGDFEMGSVGEFGEETKEGDFVVCSFKEAERRDEEGRGEERRERGKEKEGELVELEVLQELLNEEEEDLLTSKTWFGIVTPDGVDPDALSTDETHHESLTEVVVSSEANEGGIGCRGRRR